jgi:hypothetical protein
VKRAPLTLAAAVAAALLAHPLPAREAPPDASDIVNTLLTGLLGFQEVTGAELQKEVAEAGGVAFRYDVTLECIDRAELARYLRDVFDSEYPEGRARAEERTLRALDLLPAGTDLRALRARVLEQNIAGFYDERPGRKRLYAVSADRRLTPANQLILSHELRHALQDQYVDLHAALPSSIGDFDDRRLAWLSLMEGDATLVMERFLLRRLPGIPEDAGEASALVAGAMPMPSIPGAPPVVRDQLVLPYLAGLDFARALWKRGGTQALREAWSRPPESTEQVLHPEKYFAGEAPRAVEEIPAPPGAGPLSEGVLGEMLTRTLLEDGFEEAAAGWGGDHFRAFDLSGRTLLAWKSVWDSSRDAEEFGAALRVRFRRTHGPAEARSGFSVFRSGGWSLAVGEEGGGVLVLSSDDPKALADAIARARP